MPETITYNLDLWSSALLTRSTAGRGTNGKLEAYGIKKLRELILELAVRGKLLPQDPNDEPANVLLEKIAKEKAQLIREGKIKNFDVLPEVSDDEKTYSAPKTWVWARLGYLFEIVYGKGLPTSKLTEEGYDVFGANGIIGKYSEYTFEESQLLISCRGAYSGKANLSPPKCFITSNTLILQNSWDHLDLQYFYYALSIADKSKIVTGSAQPQVTTTNLSPFVVAIPPLKEQHRIVVKVDELMALCDQLEQQQTHSIQAHQTLVASLLGTLTRVESQQEFSAAWARIASHFDTLFTTDASIDQLKQTILQLAVMGKLVPQDPNDDSVDELVALIQTERASLIKAGRIKKEKPLTPITIDSIPFELPDEWRWRKIGDTALFTEYGISHQTFISESGVPVLKMGDIQDGQVILGGQKKVSELIEELPKLYLEKYDLLYNRTNSAELVGKTGIFLGNNSGYTFASYLIRIRFSQISTNPNYFNLAMNAPYFRNTQILPCITQQCGQANVNGTMLKNMIVPIPPLAEQHRIVAKVDELMALCDTLKARLADAQTIQFHLADAIVEQAVC